MSVHHRTRTWYHQEEGVPLDTPSVYGLTKGLGEVICAYFSRWFDMNLIALRITGPRPRPRFLEERRSRPEGFEETRGPGGAGAIFATDEEDLADAYLAALDAVQVGHGRFDAVFVAGDESEAHHNLTKARRLLGWEPRSQRHLGTSPAGDMGAAGEGEAGEGEAGATGAGEGEAGEGEEGDG